jgi:hypothetical protein
MSGNSGNGKRGKKLGRRPHNPPLKPHCIQLTEDQAKLLRMWGRGDLSAGLRWLIEAAAPMVGKPKKE